MKSILLVEDNEEIADGIKHLLEREDFLVCTSKTLHQANYELTKSKYDLILLDVILPDGNGLEFLRSLKLSITVPVIFLTARDLESEIVEGIELGAEDYIIKSFKTKELIARIKKVIRKDEEEKNIKIKNITFLKESNIVYKGNQEIYLTALEHKLLKIFIENKGKILTRQYLLSQIWDVSNNFVNDNTLTVYMKRLREKIEDDPEKPEIIKTIRGCGYKIEKK